MSMTVDDSIKRWTPKCRTALVVEMAGADEPFFIAAAQLAA
jgi:hypothetical protein